MITRLRLTGLLITLTATVILLSGFQAWKLARMIQKRIDIREFLPQ